MNYEGGRWIFNFLKWSLNFFFFIIHHSSFLIQDVPPWLPEAKNAPLIYVEISYTIQECQKIPGDMVL
jgi:hypothetical protein